MSDVLENFALSYASSNEILLRVVVWAVMFAGGFAYAIRPRFHFRLSRSVYFLLWSIGLTLSRAPAFFYVLSSKAVTGGYFFWLVAANHFSYFILGYGNGMFAVARSRDALKKHSMWFYAFIPVAHLVLFFISSADENNDSNFVKWLFAIVTVLFGLFIVVFGGFVSYEIETALR